MKEKGYLRAYGISTNNFEVLKRFNTHNTCSIVECDYSLLNRKSEAKMLPYCRENGIAVLVRGPLAQGLLSGKYSADTVFTDTIRAKWHQKEAKQAKFNQDIQAVAALKRTLPPGEEMATMALRYVISHPAQPVAIPGAKSSTQAALNAQAGNVLLTLPQREALLRGIKPVAV
jgi:myo-inositol catabolism protein IolS